MKLLVPLLLPAASCSNAFVHRSPPSTPGRVNKVTSLHLFEPTHIFDQVVSSLSLADADAISGPPEAGGVSYSRASYYTILGLYLLSFPGLWSTVKRSTTAKVKRKTFVAKGEKATAGAGKSLREEAGGIMACKDIFFASNSSSRALSNSVVNIMVLLTFWRHSCFPTQT